MLFICDRLNDKSSLRHYSIKPINLEMLEGLYACNTSLSLGGEEKGYRLPVYLQDCRPYLCKQDSEILIIEFPEKFCITVPCAGWYENVVSFS